MPLISVKKLTVKYGSSIALENATFTVEAGDYIGLAGPNGAGKSTLIKSLLGLIPKSSGTIDIIDRQSIGYLPQKDGLANPLFPATVREVISLGSPDQKDINEILQKLKISDVADKLIRELSGGQQQRVFLARALVAKPKLLLLDEPSTALDPVIRQDFFRIIKKLNEKDHVAVILITHDTGTIGHYAKKLMYLDKKIIFYGAFNDFCSSGDMNSYFGEFAQHIICHQHHDCH